MNTLASRLHLAERPITRLESNMLTKRTVSFLHTEDNGRHNPQPPRKPGLEIQWANTCVQHRVPNKKVLQCRGVNDVRVRKIRHIRIVQPRWNRKHSLGVAESRLLCLPGLLGYSSSRPGPSCSSTKQTILCPRNSTATKRTVTTNVRTEFSKRLFQQSDFIERDSI